MPHRCVLQSDEIGRRAALTSGVSFDAAFAQSLRLDALHVARVRRLCRHDRQDSGDRPGARRSARSRCRPTWPPAAPVYVPQPPPPPEARELNSLWRQGSRSFFRDPRAAKVGDILTVSIAIGDQAKIANTTSRSADGVGKRRRAEVPRFRKPAAGHSSRCGRSVKPGRPQFGFANHRHRHGRPLGDRST